MGARMSHSHRGFETLVIANRGEIAVRVIRTARRLGLRTVAVFSDADAGAAHVRLADSAVRIGPAAPSASYLAIDAILAAARLAGADAVHPGYGFLSENAAFARACTEAGLCFVGPPADAIEAMGDKAAAKKRMAAAGVPVLPGYLGDAQDDATLHAEAERAGLPLLVKAVSGGGGRGMRLVRTMDELPSALASARREAKAAFGDDRLLLERLVDSGRHIEVQVFADAHGNAVHLGERDCTAQRRRQKVIEEAPSAIVDPTMREAMGAAAVAAARAVGYRGAGTVEFIVDAERRFYFLEMNTRLQVEHPVTEAITGLDLVEWQLRVAGGEPLPLRQDQITLSGHAIEARWYAEDPGEGFAPQSGRIHYWRPERHADADLRIDSGIREGATVTPHYDPLLAKLIVHGRDRADAIRRLRNGLRTMPLLGLRHNGRFLADLLDHAAFRTATMDTAMLDRWAADGQSLFVRPAPSSRVLALAAALRFCPGGRFGWRPASVAACGLTLESAGVQRSMRVAIDGDDVLVDLGDATHRIRLESIDDGCVRWSCDGLSADAVFVEAAGILHLHIDGDTFAFSEPVAGAQTQTDDPRQLRAPLTGRVIEVTVAEGERVTAGQRLFCMEAMKMEIWVEARHPGVVRVLHARPGPLFDVGTLLAELDIDPIVEAS
jgi:geranyl-CoA carboxylase alpha subunit